MVAVRKRYTENSMLNKQGRKNLQKVTHDVPKMNQFNQPMSQDGTKLTVR